VCHDLAVGRIPVVDSRFEHGAFPTSGDMSPGGEGVWGYRVLMSKMSHTHTHLTTRMSSAVLPLNIGPIITSIRPIFGRMIFATPDADTPRHGSDCTCDCVSGSCGHGGTDSSVFDIEVAMTDHVLGCWCGFFIFTSRRRELMGNMCWGFLHFFPGFCACMRVRARCV